MLNPVPAPTPAKPAKFMIGSAAVSVNADGLISLTDLWKVGGAKPKNQPSTWAQNEKTWEFINHIAGKEKVGISQVFSIQRGRNGGSYAHWQVALAYAKWLSPELHMQINEVYARYKAGDATLAEEVIEKVENPDDLERIERRARAKRQYKRLSSVVFNNGGAEDRENGPRIASKPGNGDSPRSRAKRCQIGRI